MFEDYNNAKIDNIIKSKEFKNWFGDWENDPDNSSKVVDDNGFPLVVYHATYSNIDIFRPSIDHRDNNDNFIQLYKGIDIPDDKWDDFIQMKVNSDGVSPYTEFWFSSKFWSKSSPVIIPCFLNIRNIIIGDEGHDGGQGSYYDYVYNKKNDGLIIPNASNSGMDYYVTINPFNIKIANGENHQFNPYDANIRK